MQSLINFNPYSDAPGQQFRQASIEIRYRQQSIHLREKNIADPSL